MTDQLGCGDNGAQCRPRRRLRQSVAIVIATGVVATGGWWLAGGDGTDPAQAQRQAEVTDRGREVMPFDLAKTTHVFTELPDGGVQTVTVNDPRDVEQIELARSHLREEGANFARGDFADPSAIHGSDMPGLAQLAAAADRIQVRYGDLADGARLTYLTADPALVEALHAWFQAQSSDHSTAGHR